MEENEKRKKVTVSLYDKDIAELERGAKLTGGNKSEYIRMLLHFIVPHNNLIKCFGSVWKNCTKFITELRITLIVMKQCSLPVKIWNNGY